MASHIRLFAPLAVPLLLALWTLRGPLRRSPVPAVLAIIVFGRMCLQQALWNVRRPQEWDFGCFWLYGHLAAAHANIYDPRAFTHAALPFVPSAPFVAAVLKVGFPYPPPTIALFLPLGLLWNLPVGLALWYAVSFAALAGAAWLLARALLPADGWRGALLVLALVLALPATLANVADAQTNFLLLLAVAFTFAARGSLAGGVWPVLALWVKPFAGALLLVDFAQLRGRRLIVSGITVVVSLAVAAAMLGPATFATYFRSNPSGREPGFTFFEDVNQSLLAGLLRARHLTPDHVTIAHQYAYLGIAALLVAATVLLCARATRGSALAFALSLALGMLIYPATLISYGVVAIVPLLVVWAERDRLPGGAGGVIALATLVAALQGSTEFGFGANLLLWLSTALALYVTGHTAAPARTSNLADVNSAPSEIALELAGSRRP